MFKVIFLRILPYSAMGFITMNNHHLGDYFCHFFQASKSRNLQVSHEKKSSYFPWNPGCLIGFGILILIYYDPHNKTVGGFHPQQIPGNNQVFLGGQRDVLWGRFELPEFHLRSNPHVISDWCGRGARVADARALVWNVWNVVVGFTGGKEGKTVWEPNIMARTNF